MKKILNLAIYAFCLISYQTKAQINTVQIKNIVLPSWVAMIDNPNTNYYHAIQVFDTYWANKRKPKGDTQMMREMKSGKKQIDGLEDSLRNLTITQKEEYELIRYHYKRFKDWRIEVKPFVQEDGRILTMNERIEIWNKQQEEIKKQNK